MILHEYNLFLLIDSFDFSALFSIEQKFALSDRFFAHHPVEQIVSIGYIKLVHVNFVGTEYSIMHRYFFAIQVVAMQLTGVFE